MSNFNLVTSPIIVVALAAALPALTKPVTTSPKAVRLTPLVDPFASLVSINISYPWASSVAVAAVKSAGTIPKLAAVKASETCTLPFARQEKCDLLPKYT